MGAIVTVLLLGDSQGLGLRAPLSRLLAARGYELDQRSWTESGASLGAIASHVPSGGEWDLAIVVSGGGNENAGADPAAYRQKLDDLAQQLRARASRVVFVGPLRATDPRVSGLHDAARAIQREGIRGAQWVDGYALSSWVSPTEAGVHYSANSMSVIARELDRAIFASGMATAIGLVGTLAFVGAVGVIAIEAWLGAATPSD